MHQLDNYTQKEIWKDIKGHEGHYQVSNLGRVKSLDRIVVCLKRGSYHVKEKVLSIVWDKFGYGRVGLSKDERTIQIVVHRLVAIAFIPNPKNYPIVMHKVESNPCNNNVDNLMWGTYKMNTHDMISKKRTNYANGEKSSMYGKREVLIRYLA